MKCVPVADPGFPVGGRGPITGGVDLRRGCFSPKMCAKMKELGPVGGHVPGTPPRSANAVRLYKLPTLPSPVSLDPGTKEVGTTSTLLIINTALQHNYSLVITTHYTEGELWETITSQYVEKKLLKYK